MNNTPVIECRNLEKTFIDADLNVEVLKGLNLTLNKSEQAAIVGASGSGKSTLLHLLGGLDKPTQGEVLIGGTNFVKVAASIACRLRNKMLGFVYQFHHLLPEFTALENVAMPLLIGNVPVADATEQAADILAKVGLQNRLKHKPSKLSGGERQRAAIARALVTKPACVLADEPTGNLDNKNALQVYELLLQLNQEFDVAFIIVTHDKELAAMVERTYVLENGNLQIS